MDNEKLILEILARICLDKTNFVNADFGADNKKLYIDGCAEYLNENEKKAVKEWLNSIGYNPFNMN